VQNQMAVNPMSLAWRNNKKHQLEITRGLRPKAARFHYIKVADLKGTKETQRNTFRYFIALFRLSLLASEKLSYQTKTLNT